MPNNQLVSRIIHSLSFL